jgi:hypothetical protein
VAADRRPIVRRSRWPSRPRSRSRGQPPGHPQRRNGRPVCKLLIS